MKEPLIPDELHDQLCWKADIEHQRPEFKNKNIALVFSLLKLKYWINKLPKINFDTLKFIMFVYKIVAKNEPLNRMTAYNLAAHVTDSIFRSKDSRPDLKNIESFELVTHMI